jgi:hypothetical protein
MLGRTYQPSKLYPNFSGAEMRRVNASGSLPVANHPPDIVVPETTGPSIWRAGAGVSSRGYKSVWRMSLDTSPSRRGDRVKRTFETNEARHCHSLPIDAK